MLTSGYILPVVFLTLHVFVCNVRGEMSKYEVKEKLLNDTIYNAEIKPKQGSVTNVDVQVDIYEMTRVDEHTEFTFSMFLRMWWSDHRLDFSNFSNYNKLEFAEENVQKLWQPDVFFLGNQKPDKSNSNRMMYVYRNGSTVYSERTSVVLVCKFNYTYYPHDEVICQLKLQSFTYTSDSLVLKWHNTNPVETPELLDFVISYTKNTNDEPPSPNQVGHFSTLKSVMGLKRNGMGNIFKLYGPSFAIFTVSWLVLWLDQTRVATRFATHTSCIIALITQWVAIYVSTPTVPYIRVIDLWMIAHLGFVVVAFISNFLSTKAGYDDSIDDYVLEECFKKRTKVFNCKCCKTLCKPGTLFEHIATVVLALSYYCVFIVTYCYAVVNETICYSSIGIGITLVVYSVIFVAIPMCCYVWKRDITVKPNKAGKNGKSDEKDPGDEEGNTNTNDQSNATNIDSTNDQTRMKTLININSTNDQTRVKTPPNINSTNDQTRVKTPPNINSTNDQTRMKTPININSTNDKTRVKTPININSTNDQTRLKTPTNINSTNEQTRVKTPPNVNIKNDQIRMKTPININSTNDQTRVKTPINMNSTNDQIEESIPKDNIKGVRKSITIEMHEFKN